MEKESSGERPVKAKSTGGQGSRRAVAPSDEDDDDGSLNRRLGGHQRQSGRYGEDKNVLPLPVFEPRTIHFLAQLLY
jgi:hypothetical protein